MIGQNEIPFSVLKGLVHFARRIDAQVFGLESGSLESAKQQQSVGFGILDEQNAQGTAESSNVRFSVHAIGRVQRAGQERKRWPATSALCSEFGTDSPGGLWGYVPVDSIVSPGFPSSVSRLRRGPFCSRVVCRQDLR